MARLHKKVTELLGPELPDFAHALEKLPGGRVSGVVVSSAFNTLSHRKRQDLLQDILRDGLSDKELLAIGAIATLTPSEAYVKAS